MFITSLIIAILFGFLALQNKKIVARLGKAILSMITAYRLFQAAYPGTTIIRDYGQWDVAITESLFSERSIIALALSAGCYFVIHGVIFWLMVKLSKSVARKLMSVQGKYTGVKEIADVVFIKRYRKWTRRAIQNNLVQPVELAQKDQIQKIHIVTKLPSASCVLMHFVACIWIILSMENYIVLAIVEAFIFIVSSMIFGLLIVQFDVIKSVSDHEDELINKDIISGV